jgi:hypothetical protein
MLAGHEDKLTKGDAHFPTPDPGYEKRLPGEKAGWA